MSKLYQTCPVCLAKDAGCLVCSGRGLVETGVTTGQVERWAAWERWLNGDPTLSEAELTTARDYIVGRLQARGIFQADDPEPVTAEWLSSRYPIQTGAGYVVGGGLRVCESCDGWGLYLYDSDPDGDDPLRVFAAARTRGQLLRILAAIAEGDRP